MKSFISLISLLIVAGFQARCAEQWALVSIPVACVRAQPAHASEMVTQFVAGTPLQVTDMNDGEWIGIQGPDGYPGYINVSGLQLLDDAAMDTWRATPRAAVVSMAEATVYADTVFTGPRNVVTTLVSGSIVAADAPHGRWVNVTLPDGADGWIERNAVQELRAWASQPVDTERMLARCYAMKGQPYLWGGCTTKSADCSGLVRLSLYADGVLAPRDAHEQMMAGRFIPAYCDTPLQRGDLLFFSPTPDGSVTHVAVYDGDGKYIHCSGRVKVNAMSADDPDFGHRCYRGAARYARNITGHGLCRLIEHPWYFLIDKPI